MPPWSAPSSSGAPPRVARTRPGAASARWRRARSSSGQMSYTATTPGGVTVSVAGAFADTTLVLDDTSVGKKLASASRPRWGPPPPGSRRPWAPRASVPRAATTPTSADQTPCRPGLLHDSRQRAGDRDHSTSAVPLSGRPVRRLDHHADHRDPRVTVTIPVRSRRRHRPSPGISPWHAEQRCSVYVDDAFWRDLHRLPAPRLRVDHWLGYGHDRPRPSPTARQRSGRKHHLGGCRVQRTSARRSAYSNTLAASDAAAAATHHLLGVTP